MATRIDWYGKEVEKIISQAMKERVKQATIFLKAKVRENINVPVTRSRGPRGGQRVIRSKPGEYPRKDTKALRKDIFGITRKTSRGVWDGFVGSTLPYAVYLELGIRIKKRSFLVRTLREEQNTIKSILTRPIP